MNPRFGIIGGSGLAELFPLRSSFAVETPYGAVTLFEAQCAGEAVAFLPRHGMAHTIPPHKVNYAANIFGLSKLGVQSVLATSAVGSMNLSMRPGDIVVVHQFIDMTKSRRCTFFDGDGQKVVHADMTEPYDRQIRGALIKAGKRLNVRMHNHGVYVCMEGPRFETPAEIRMLKRFGGDVVGMTGVPEVVLANELGLKYGSLCVVTNWAAGYQPRISHEEVKELMSKMQPKVKRIIEKTIEHLAG